MIAELHTSFERILTAYAGGRNLILLFDYDGTLVPIVDHPRLAVLLEQTRGILERLIRLPRVHVGILSGRHLADLRLMVGVSGLYLAGTSGLELDFAGIRVAHPSAGSTVPALERVSELLAAVVQEFAGAWLERKPMGLTIHFRHVSQQATGELRNRVQRVVSGFKGRLHVLESTKSLEITPDLGWDKGSAVRMIVNSIGAPDALVLYAGDSANDAEAMKATTALDGITIGVGLEAPRMAHVHVAEPDDVSDLIAALADTLSTGRKSENAISPCGFREQNTPAPVHAGHD